MTPRKTDKIRDFFVVEPDGIFMKCIHCEYTPKQVFMPELLHCIYENINLFEASFSIQMYARLVRRFKRIRACYVVYITV